jgi:NodT family efflux transporter outer membrane factor (OMF) lipoprotein
VYHPQNKCAFVLFLLIILALLSSSGCTNVVPDFIKPVAPVSQNCMDEEGEKVGHGPADYREWWKGFNDPVLDRLIDAAYRQNLSLKIAGVRVLEARAQLGIAIGGFYPQSQYTFGSLDYKRISERAVTAGALNRFTYSQSEIGLGASWELDFWGKFRRAIESADAGLMATIADYDSVLVALTGDVANSYILIRTLEKRIDIANENVQTQAESLRIAEVRFKAGTTSQRDVEQAKTVLNDTRALIPTLTTQLRQAKNALSVLLGLPPSDLKEMLAGPAGIPAPPPRVAIGIPADLLRRRPDIRSAEYQAAAQSALIGVAKADLFPAFSLAGSFGLLATSVGRSSSSDIFRWSSREYSIGPGFQWSFLNYGRLTNLVRVQDARFQQLLISYQNTVLRAQQEVEDALVGFLRAQERAEFLAQSAGAARRSFDLAATQYREGVTDFTTVLTAQQALLNEQDNLATTLGSISSNLVGIYRALGGGWEIREGGDMVPADVKEAMAARTDWGDLLSPASYLPPSSETPRSLVRPPDW